MQSKRGTGYGRRRAGAARPIVVRRVRRAVRVRRSVLRAAKRYQPTVDRLLKTVAGYPAALTTATVNAALLAFAVYAFPGASAGPSAGDVPPIYPADLRPPVIAIPDVEPPPQAAEEPEPEEEPPPPAAAPARPQAPVAPLPGPVLLKTPASALILPVAPARLAAVAPTIGPPASAPRPQAPSRAAAAPSAAAVAQYWNGVRNRIAAEVSYPSAARNRHAEGRVTVKITLRPDGGLIEAIPLEEAAERSLTRAVLAAVRRAAPFDAPGPLCASSTNALSTAITIRFELTDEPEQAAAGDQSKSATVNRRQGAST